MLNYANIRAHLEGPQDPQLCADHIHALSIYIHCRKLCLEIKELFMYFVCLYLRKPLCLA